AVALAVTADEAGVFEAAVGRVGPAGTDRVGEADSANRARVDGVLAIEVDAVPIDEALAAPRRDDTQGIVIVKYPVPAARHAAWSGIEAHRDALVGKVALVADFHGQHQARPIVHVCPRLDA